MITRTPSLNTLPDMLFLKHREGSMKIEEYISAERDICHGKPCFKGTQIMVASILELNVILVLR